MIQWIMYENKVVERSIGINFNTKCLFLDAPLCCCLYFWLKIGVPLYFSFTMVAAAVVVYSVSKSIIVDVDNN